MKTNMLWSTALLAVLLTTSSQIYADRIDFEGLPAGTIVDELTKGAGISDTNITGFVGVVGHNTYNPATNAAVIFDSECIRGTISCETQDQDIATPHEDFGGPGIGIGGALGGSFPNDTPLGNLIILVRKLTDSDNDGLVDDPDDADVPGYFNFDFSTIKKGKISTVTIDSVTIMDVDLIEGEDPGQIILTGPGIPQATISVFDTENGGVATIDGIGLAGVDNVRVEVLGSSAFAEIVFNESKAPRSCWITTGGFHNAGVQSGGKDFTFGGNVGPPPSGSWEVIDHNTGDNFHSNDVHITDCIEIDGTGPGQPGGKKGFVINQAFFEGTGRLNHVDGYPFTGFVVDRGEPSGKNDNQKDQFHIEVRDPVSSVVVFETDFLLDGGNVQIHPPVGKPN